MKKILCSLALLLSITSTVQATTVRPSIDGRVVVAEKGTLPAGMFAKTVGYLPGDSVSISNPTSGNTIEVLVLGSIAPEEGVAIMLSHEAAEKLGITKDAYIQVKISKRSGLLDGAVTGSAVLSRTDIAEAVPARAEQEPASTPEHNPQDGIIEEEPRHTPAQPSSEEIPLTETDQDSIMPPTSTAESLNPNEPLADISGTEQEEPLPLKKDDETAEPTDNGPEETEWELVENPVFEDDKRDIEQPSLLEKQESLSESTSCQPAHEAIAKKTEPEPSEAEEYNSDEPVANLDQKAAPQTAAPDAERVEVEELTPAQDSAEPFDEPEVYLAYTEEPGQEHEPEPESEAEPHTPIVLVPTHPQIPDAPPKRSAALVPTEIVLEEQSPARAARPKAAYIPTEKVAEGNAHPAPEQKTKTARPSIPEHTLPSEDSLKAGKCYVQVATMKETKNIEGMLERYSNYPLVLIPREAGGYKVLVGPLGEDEYGAVLETFRNFGFSDAFVKRIKR